jgi:hypothetical protein
MDGRITIGGKTALVSCPDDELQDDIKAAKYFANNDDLKVGELTKYYLNENLNFLCGSGTSVGVGGKTINTGSTPFSEILTELNALSRKSEFQKNIIAYLEGSDLLEIKLDKINQEYLYYLNNKKDTLTADKIKKILNRILKEFVTSYVPFPEDYAVDKLVLHQLFISKIVSRKETINRPRIFTLNYDLAFENACEKIGVDYNNGFRGTHLRKFDPDTYYNESYIKQTSPEKGKRLSTYLNIYKLHGSISWKYNESVDDLYNLQEVQIPSTLKKEDFETDSLIIYPIQTKKSYSLDLPYSEIFRSFSKALTDNQNTLVVLGYSFLDEHINDIIRTGLYNPNITVIIHTYSMIDDDSPKFLQTLKNRCLSDNRIIICEGPLLGSFMHYVKYLLPLSSNMPSRESMIETLRKLLKD